MHTIRLRREFGFNSDVISRTLALRKELGSGSVDEAGEKMVDQGCGEAWVAYGH
ncbi:Nucleosome Assembly Protein 1-Like 2, partial [Manis pentadactyla]